MEKKFKLTNTYKLVTIILIAIGVGAVVVGAIGQTQRLWANLLLNNYYFLSLAVGASFFMAIQYITQSGWSAMFKRIPEAMTAYIPVAFILMIILLGGLQSLYHWTHPEAVTHDPLLQHKAPYLNIPFFTIRFIVFFAAWIVLTLLLRKFSSKEDELGGMKYFQKSEFYSRVYIFVLGITFIVFTFDWIMSIDPHWYSTVFAIKGFVTAFYHGSAIIVLIIILLHNQGYFNKLNKSHLMDFSRYIFMLAIIWGYLTFVEFMLIWYGNIPEETMYFHDRFTKGYETLFYVNFAINWFIPFLILMSRSLDRKKTSVAAIAIIL
ncbi:MAG: hypothetical protein K9I74_07495, partial [Bacteroidales bacterium]|nr:hypothetical protein [Bacteroidales bacterium]